MMETEPTYDQQQQQQQRSTPTKNKAGEFGRPLIPFFLNEDANGETPTGGYSVNEDLFLTDEQAQQQERVFVPRGEKSIRVREFKDGYFEYKDLSFDAIQEKLTFHSPIKQQQQQANNNQPQFFSQHVEINNKNNSSNGNNGNGHGKMTKTSSRDHFANYERMVIPFQHKNNMVKSNDNSSSSDENKRQSDEIEDEDKKAKKKKQKKKVMVPVNVQKQNVSSRNTNHLIRNHENQPSNNQSSNQEFVSSQSQQQQTNYSIQQQQQQHPAIMNHGAVYPQPLVMHSPLIFNPPSPVYPKSTTTHQLLTPSLFGITRPSPVSTSNNSSQSPSSTLSSSGLLRPSALLNQSYKPTSPVKPTPSANNIPPQQIPNYLPQQSYDVSFIENNLHYYQEQQQQQPVNYPMNGAIPHIASEQPVAAVEQLPPVSQMVTSNSSTSLTEKELLSILMNDGSVNFTPDEPENVEQKHKKFAGGSWSNSPHPSEIPKPNFK